MLTDIDSPLDAGKNASTTLRHCLRKIGKEGSFILGETIEKVPHFQWRRLIRPVQVIRMPADFFMPFARGNLWPTVVNLRIICLQNRNREGTGISPAQS
jgi:hypothetical protein